MTPSPHNSGYGDFVSIQVPVSRFRTKVMTTEELKQQQETTSAKLTVRHVIISVIYLHLFSYNIIIIIIIILIIITTMQSAGKIASVGQFTSVLLQVLCCAAVCCVVLKCAVLCCSIL
jgi:hypothetical protein